MARRRPAPLATPPKAVITVSYAPPGTGAPSRDECVARALNILLREETPQRAEAEQPRKQAA